MIDFDKNECNSIKLIVIKGNTNVDLTSRFIIGKMLLFSKVLLKWFALKVFCKKKSVTSKKVNPEK